MFEKEAEEYIKEHTFFDEEYGVQSLDVVSKTIFQDGAEFGYNKANEWHYVKDELPPVKKEYNGRSELVLVLSEEKEMQYAQYVEKEKTWARGIFEINFKPYAWKEIILPELKENDIKRELFPEITLPEGSAELVDKVIADAEKRLKENE